MKTTLIAVLFATAAAATNASAEGLTRAQVRAEVLAARAAGTLSSGGEGYQLNVYAPSVRSRADVLAELAAARAAGLPAEGEAYPGPAPASAPVTRAAVRTELAAAPASARGLEGRGDPASY